MRPNLKDLGSLEERLKEAALVEVYDQQGRQLASLNPMRVRWLAEALRVYREVLYPERGNR